MSDNSDRESSGSGESDGSGGSDDGSESNSDGESGGSGYESESTDEDRIFHGTRAGRNLLNTIRSWRELESVPRMLALDIDGTNAHNITNEDIDSVLSALVGDGDYEGCRAICESLCNVQKHKFVHAENSSYHPPMHAAVAQGNIRIVHLFQHHSFNINQKDYAGRPPLYFALFQLDLQMTRLLLESGADPNVIMRLPYNFAVVERLTDLAIKDGNTQGLLLLLQHGALVYTPAGMQTSLRQLLREDNERKPRETKLSICRTLFNHATQDHDTTMFLQETLTAIISVKEDSNPEHCEILFEAGVRPSTKMFYYPIHHKNEVICRMLVRYGGNPFQIQPVEMQSTTSNNNATDETSSSTSRSIFCLSPFHAAGQQTDTVIFSFFLQLWYERFNSNGVRGRNDHGDTPLHVLCRDPHVSIEAIKVLVNEHKANVADAVTTNDGLFLKGFLPVHLAAMSDTRLDVIYYLLKRYPDALGAQQRPVDAVSAVDKKTCRTTKNHLPTASSSSSDGSHCKKKAKTMPHK